MEMLIQFITDFLGTPAILVGVIILVGLLAQKKGVSDVVRGTIKGVLGFLILGAGAGVIVGAIVPFGSLFGEAFNMQGVVPNNEAIVAEALGTYGSATAIIMVVGMIANIIIARFTKLKYIFLTGHHTLYMAAMIAIVLVVAGFEGILLYLFGGMALGLTMAFFPAIAQPTMRKITGNDDIAFGHFSTLTYVLSAKIGKLVGKGSKSTEETSFPKGLAFLRDSSISIALTMMAMYLIVVIIAGPAYTETLSGGQNFIIYALLQAITFAAGVYIVLQGVRLVIAEIVPAFKGFSEKLVPNAKPALDCPVVFPFAPNAVLIGFLSSFLGGVVGMLILVLLRDTALSPMVILPGVVPHFFVGATAGVFGNATGGRRGAIFGSFVNGLVITFLPLFLLPVLGDLGYANTTFSDADFIGVGILIGWVATFKKAWLVGAVITTLFAIPFVHAMLNKDKLQAVEKN
ncbi:PTS ascorbate transporter subunit IIC [Alkalibacter saccharofermentans]|uniref:Ascorbate-specific PTS system EIIC component n=1 Tax=Alkalibacter saccharofermentans DSM 14828 TaxID=1120975 RepID=A0A1M4ZJ59_9FIRM|nr:PTS ascorbate transporter subunit IIC [Alkalibacter saccharofermentans]SHF18083.1 PTS system IIC component, L-Asc family (TC 4.A.7) [Alkalibacter saccharofermentans DSM 14828]